MSPLVALAVVAAAHAGFQVTVTALAYPALATVPADRFAAAHGAHSRRIVPLVGLVYLGVLLVGGWALVAAPLGAAALTALAAQAAVLLVTAAQAAPLHAALGRRGAEPALLRRLLGVDRVRAALTVTGLVAALLAL
ncbi:hypothetical protein [Phycicoccus duodecadis]|uniref:DUF1772 domain-containing protein n=1 Tax=Phycicoccus duodecadis TaxID=173053 RepID=A0A2N3YLU7_9MICO|nr:hypothetical protein [Phycicoccus duodecadis]PKW27841.1 hypothetical protein ATL31_2692 [Phycicoccus duodecadis]